MSEGVHRTKFHANPVQDLFITSRAEADLFSCRMGEGKSTALVWACFYHTSHNPGARWAFIRDTFENLRDTTQKTFFEWFPPGIYGTYNASSKTFKWNCKLPDGTPLTGEVLFIGMDDPKDAAKLQSRELAGLAIDEAAPAAETGGVPEFVFDTAMTRLRQPGMQWYAVKIAQNNPDETHWTYERFVDPGDPNFRFFQTREAENEKNLPKDYYKKMRRHLAHRPDLQKRFVDGKFGFTQIGDQVTPEWNDDLHLVPRLEPVRNVELILCWDFGLRPTCVITQVTPLGQWNILEAHQLIGQGTIELIETVVRPRLTTRFAGWDYRHIGDPAGTSPDQTSVKVTPVKAIIHELGGKWKSGPIRLQERIEPLKAVLMRTVRTTGMVQVDREHARIVYHALRGGWHYPVSRAGVTGQDPVKDHHSDPGDAVAYAAAVLFPLGRLKKRRAGKVRPRAASYSGLGFERPGVYLPPEARKR